MRKGFISFGLILFAIAGFAQNGVKIHVETLQPPADALPEKSYTTGLEQIIAEANHWDTQKENYSLSIINSAPKFTLSTLPYNIVAKSAIQNSLALTTTHAFYDALLEAYAHHRPFVLSPDMVWLLIAQGFAQHINNNAEKLRHYFVQHQGKIALIIQNNQLTLNNPDAPWEKEAFPAFAKQIGNYTGQQLLDVLTNNFSTSTPSSIAASQITAMESMKAYFEFVTVMVGCGIPDITLEGTPDDWEKIEEKTGFIRKYDLNWWIDSISPVLKKITAAAKGEKDTTFWQNMFQYHKGGLCGGPRPYANGWIVKFFPYNKDGHRNKLDTIYNSDMLPPEMVHVPLRYITMDPATGLQKEKALEIWAGFVGAEQNKSDFTLKPEIGWMIREADTMTINREKELMDNFNSGNKPGQWPIVLRVSEFPKALLSVKKIYNLDLYFSDSIRIPAAIKNIQIQNLQLHGNITTTEAVGIARLLPETLLLINRKDFSNSESAGTIERLIRNNGPYYRENILYVDSFPKRLFGLDTMTIKTTKDDSAWAKLFHHDLAAGLFYKDTVYNLRLVFTDSIQIPKEAGKINFDILYLDGKVSSGEKLRISRLFPHAMLFINDSLCTKAAFVRQYFRAHDDNVSALRFHINRFPQQFLQVDSVKSLALLFDDNISLPSEIGDLKIENLFMTGKINEDAQANLYQLLPNTVLNFNNYYYAPSMTKSFLQGQVEQNKGNRYPLFLQVSDFPEALSQLDSVSELILDFRDSVKATDSMKKDLKIHTLKLQGKISQQETDKIRILLPDTELYFNGKKYIPR